MKNIVRRAPPCVAFAAVLSGAAALAAPLTPGSGPLVLTGGVTTSDGSSGRLEIKAVLREGNFSGMATLEIDGRVVSGPLLVKRSYLENGNCYFRFENAKARADVGGQCDSTELVGRFETFIPGDGMRTGAVKANLVLTGAAPASAATAQLPSGKLVCAFNEPKFGFKLGETTQYSLRFSNMGTLELAPGGSYVAGGTARGRFVQTPGGKITLTSGPWADAVGSLENDRSGVPAVVFHIDENRRPNKVHIVDPYTTRCTKPR